MMSLRDGEGVMGALCSCVNVEVVLEMSLLRNGKRVMDVLRLCVDEERL